MNALIPEKVNACIGEMARWFAEHRKESSFGELELIIGKHFPEEADRRKFKAFLDSPEGQERFKKQLRLEAWRAHLGGEETITGLEVYRVTCGFEEDAALRRELETQGYKLYAVFETPEAAREAALKLTGQDIKLVKHISTPETGEVPTWEIYSKPAAPEAGDFWLGIAGAERKFPLGQIVMTRGVSDLVAENPEFARFAAQSLRRHAGGDWGDLSEEDKRENEYALGRHLRLFSAYEKPPLPKIWIITEADRSVTTILFPEEY